MFSKVLIQFLCLSLALVEIKAMVRHPESENDLSYEKNEPEPIEEQPHHRCRHHKQHNHHRGPARQPPQPEDVILPHPPHGHHMPPPPPHQEVLIRLLPVLRSLINKDYHKTGGLDASDDSKLESQSKTKAFVKSTTNTKYTETMIENNKITNDSKVLTKTLETSGETDAIIDFNSDMDVISDKVLKANTDEESKPVPEKPELRMERHHHQKLPSRTLRRMKRSDEAVDEGKKSWDNIMGAFKKVGEAIKEGFKKHVEEPVKKFVDNLKKEAQAKKKGGAAGGEGQAHPADSTEAPHSEKQHEEK